MGGLDIFLHTNEVTQVELGRENYTNRSFITGVHYVNTPENTGLEMAETCST
jgi:hypothetical protein